jgi:hypothetical protein
MVIVKIGLTILTIETRLSPNGQKIVVIGPPLPPPQLALFECLTKRPIKDKLMRLPLIESKSICCLFRLSSVFVKHSLIKRTIADKFKS